MKLTEEQAKKIVSKVLKDLKLYYEDKIPIKVNFINKDSNANWGKINYWAGFYDYSKLPKEFNLDKGIPYDSVVVDDEKGIAIAVSFFPEPSPIKLDENGKYIWGNE
ncbi:MULTISPECIES: hypothetical protein [Flavobacterium]|uniref:Immunity protein 35 n=1 Tax=Flavobacterium jumunjinense TaxID=998845 RepID=A0ABV5GNH9_9FLAO|nr:MULTISPECIES: hypothetical protein [Flavobacterium]